MADTKTKEEERNERNEKKPPKKLTLFLNSFLSLSPLSSSSSLRSGRFLVLRPLHLRVQENTTQSNSSAGQRARAHGVAEDDDRRHDHDDSFHAVSDRVRDGADAGEDHVRHLLVGVEAGRGGQGLLDDRGGVCDSRGGEGRGREPHPFLEQSDGGQESEGEDRDDREEVDVVLSNFE